MNKLTHGSNLRWESSRMMLPEHREAINDHNLSKNHRERKELDDQEWDIIHRALRASLQQRIPITAIMYDKRDELVVSGVVDFLDARMRGFSVDGEWFAVEDIESVEMPDSEFVD